MNDEILKRRVLFEQIAQFFNPLMEKGRIVIRDTDTEFEALMTELRSQFFGIGHVCYTHEERGYSLNFAWKEHKLKAVEITSAKLSKEPSPFEIFFRAFGLKDED